MRRLLPALALIALVALSGCSLVFKPKRDPTETLIDGGRVAAHLDTDLRIPIVEATVNGKGPYAFLVDTGAFCFIIDARVAREAGCPVSMRFGRHVTDAGETAGRMDLARIDELAIGGATFRGFDGLATDLSRIVETLERPLDGVIGIPLMWRSVWTIDYPRHELVIESDAALDPDAPFVQGFMWSGETPAIAASIDDVALSIEIDTGSDSGLDLSEHDASRLEYFLPTGDVVQSTTLSGVAEGRVGILRGTLHVGDWSLPMSAVTIHPNTSIGGEILRHFAVTIDARNGLVRLVPSSSSDEVITRPAARPESPPPSPAPPPRRTGAPAPRTPDAGTPARDPS